jgi:hypothetical protein
MKYVMRLCAFFCALFLSVPVFGATFYEQDWETATLTRTPVRTGVNLVTGAYTGSPCFIASQYGFDSWSTSTKYKRKGSRSLRNENHTGLKKTDAVCNQSGDERLKSRQEIRYGSNTTEMGIVNSSLIQGGIDMGEERWYGISYYYPSDEGTFDQWWDDGDPRMNIFQVMEHGGPSGSTPAVFIVLSRSGRVDVQSKYSTDPTTEVLKTNPETSGYFIKDTWNDLVVRHKRGWDNTGILQVWINGTQVTNYVNHPVSIRSMPVAYMAAGQYWGTLVDNNIRVQYVDNIKIGDHTSSYTEVDPSADGNDNPVGENPTNIVSVNAGAAITTEQYPVNFTANAYSTDGFLSCLINDTNEKPVIYDITAKTGYFKAPDLSSYTSTSATLKCYHESQLAKVAADTSWLDHGTTKAAWTGNKFGLTTGLTITKAAVSSAYVTTGDGVDVYAAIPTWTATSSWEIEFDVIFPTSTTLPSANTSLIDGATSNNRASIYLADSSNTLRFNTVAISSVAVDGVTVADNAYVFPTDGDVRHIKAVGTGTVVLANVLRRYDGTNYVNSAVFNLSLKQLSTPANDSFYALNESIGSSVIDDTGARNSDGTWNNRVAGDITDLGAPAQNPAYVAKIPNTNSAFSGVASDRMAVDFLYSCASTGCDNLYFAVEDKASGAHRLTAVGSAGGLILATENSGFGTTTSVKNWVVDTTEGLHKARINFGIGTEGYNNIYNYYAGSKDASTGHNFILHDVIPHKNFTTQSTTFPIVLTLTDEVAPTVDPCTITNVPAGEGLETGYRATITCTTTEFGGEYFVILKDTNAAPANADAVIAGTGAIRSATGPVDNLTITAEFSGLAYQDLWAYAVHRDAATLKSTVATATFDATNKALQLGTIADPIMRGSVPLPSATYATVTIYSGNKAIDPTATVVTALQNVPVVNGVATGREEHVIPGQPSLNSIPNGTYWVLSSRPSGATYALSYGQRAIVTE